MAYWMHRTKRQPLDHQLEPIMAKKTPAPAATDIDDPLAPATGKAKKTKPAAAAEPAKGKAKNSGAAEDPLAPATGKAKKAAEPVEKPKRVREPIVFAEGEREELMAAVAKAVKKKAGNSKDLAATLEVPTRKMRQVLYSMQRAGTVTLDLEGSRTGGMTVTTA